MGAGVCFCMSGKWGLHGCVLVCVCVCVCFVFLLVKALLKALVYMILRFNYNVMDVVNVVMFSWIIISDATNEFIPGNNKGLLN